MNKILSDYLSIYKKFPLNEFFSREERKLRHSLMVDWEKQDNEDLPSLDELNIKKKLQLSLYFLID